MRILGIDPGAVSGGCAIVEISDGVAPQLVDAIVCVQLRMPCSRARKITDVPKPRSLR
jgi:Holliday junction resolvasome RuvABC endonuclease subunit